MKKIVYTNLANVVTGLRIVFTILLALQLNKLLFHSAEIQTCLVCAGFLLLICLSDFFDGRIARRLKITSNFGAAFDVAADVLFVFIIHTELAIHNLVPVWFLFVVAEKIMNYIVTSKMICRKTSDDFAFIRDPVGRIVSASYFFTPVLFTVASISRIYQIAAFFIVISIVLMGAYSSIYRIITVTKLNTQENETRVLH